ncbi:MAG: DUF2948 family protein [Pseudomonadota bacterium]
MRPLKLAALDEEDLEVMSAHVQDAVIKVADIKWTPTAGTFILPMNRFAWEEAQRPKRRASNQRRRSILHFDQVTRVRAQGVSARDKDAVISILALLFEASDDAPAGTVNLICSGETILRIDVNYIEARLTDLGAAWGASMRPKHGVGSR